MQICSTKPLRSTLLALAVLAALALVACGGDDDGGGGEGTADGADPATVAPADAAIYAGAFIRPEGERRDNLDNVLGKLLGTDDVGAQIEAMLEEEISSEAASLSYAEDIEPWLGERAGVFVTSFEDKPDAALIAAVTDEGAARDFIDKAAEADEVSEQDASYEGVDYQVDEDGSAAGLVDGFLVVGTETAFKAAVDATSGESFAEGAGADAADVDETTIFTVIGDIEQVLTALEEQGELPAETREQLEEQLGELDEPFALTGSALDDALAISFEGPEGASSGDTELVSGFPSGSWFAFALADFNQQLETFTSSFEAGFKAGFDGGDGPPAGISADEALEQFEQGVGLDLEKDLGWIGDLGGFVEGSSIFGLGGGIVLEAGDNGDARDAIDKFRDAVESSGQVQTSPLGGDADGFSAQVAGAPIGFEVELRDDRVVIAAGAADVDSVLEPDATLGDDSRFQSASDALESGSPVFYLDFTVLVDLLESTGQTSDPQLQQALPVLEALDYVIAGAEGGSASFVLGVREPEPAGEAAVVVPPLP